MKEGEAINKSTMTTYDPTTTLLNKVQKELAKLRKGRSLISRLTAKFIHRTQYHHDFVEL